MSASNLLENALLDLIFNNVVTDLANLGSGTPIAKSTTDGDLHLSLHTTPGPAEDEAQTVTEISYTGYLGRVAVGRDTGGWTVTADSVVNAADIAFGTMTAGGPITATHCAIGTTTGAPDEVLFIVQLNTPLVINNTINPTILAGQLQITVA